MNSKKTVVLLITLFVCTLTNYAQKANIYQIKSPDGDIVVKIEADSDLQWSVQHKGQQIIAPSSISLTLQAGKFSVETQRLPQIQKV